MDDGIKNVTDFQRQEGFSLDALRQGDRAEFARLVESYSDTIYRVAMKMLENEQDAEDVLQETFIKAFRGLKNFNGLSRLSTWLYRIATNEALMVLRRSQKVTVSIDEPINEDEDLAEPRQIIDWCCLPEDELMTSETRQHLDHAIDSLPPSLRVVFVLRDLEGLSTAEAAEVLNLSETAVKTRLSRARLRLRESLSGYFSGAGRLQPVAREGDA